MSNSTTLKEEVHSDNLTRKDDTSSTDSGSLNLQLTSLQMASELGDAVSVSKNSSLGERKIQTSEIGGLENDIGNAAQRDEITQTFKRDEDCLQTGRTTRSVLLSEMNLSPKKRKLILHIDLNNTILVSDAVTNQDPGAALNYYLSTVTWGKIGPKGDWQWLSESPSLHPPCQAALSFNSQYGRDTKFTDLPMGRQFRDLHRHHLQLLEWQGQPHPLLSIEGEQGKRYHLVLPSFFYLLESLHREGRQFAVIFRTFGTDLPRVLQAVYCALEGQHAQFPALWEMMFPVNLNPGTIRCSKRKVLLTQGAERLSTESDNRKVYQYFNSRKGLCGFQDHFDWWSKNKFSVHGGKPLWIDPYDTDVHHICIDDNIRLNDSDTIIHPQVFSGQGSNCVRTAPTSELYDVCLVQTDLLAAIADVTYFYRCINQCEAKYENYLASTRPCT